MPTEALIDGCAPIIRNWFDSAVLKDRTDAFRRSQELWADRSVANASETDEMYTAANREIDVAVADQCFEGLAAVRDECPDFFEAYDYEWAFDQRSYLTPIQGGTRVESQSLRAQVLLLQALTSAWKANDNHANPLAFGNICARRVTDFDPVPRCVRDGEFRYVIVSDEFRMQVLRLLGGLRAYSGLAANENTTVAMERLSAASHADFTDLPLLLLPRQIARVFRVEKRPWDLALLCMAEQQVERIVPNFDQISAGVYPAAAHSVETHLLDVITPFFLYHEAAHLLLNHTSNRSVEKEMDADGLAFAMFFASRGWRDPIDTSLGFGEVESTLLGPMFFLWVVKCFTRLEILTSSERQQVVAKHFIEELDMRRQSLAKRVAATVEIARKQVPNILPPESFRRLENLTNRLSSAAASFDHRADLTDIVSLGTNTLESWSKTL